MRLTFVISGLLVVAAIAIGLTVDGPEAVTAVAVLVGIATVLLLSAGFYAVGRSEDRDRAAERER